MLTLDELEDVREEARWLGSGWRIDCGRFSSFRRVETGLYCVGSPVLLEIYVDFA